jgi:RNA-binding protein YlmH
MTDGILQHFRPEEASFIQQVQDWIQQAVDQYQPITTPFLNPRQQYIAKTLVAGQADLQVSYWGGVTGAEQQRAVIAPEFYTLSQDDFEIQVLQINYPKKFMTLQHAQILGTVLSTGIERYVIGDILHDETTWQLAVAEQMVSYIQQQVTKIGKASVHFERVAPADVLSVQQDWQELFVILASLRLDTVIASGYNISRSNAKALVEGGAVQVNWQLVEKPNWQIAVGDIISVRRYGRLRIANLTGITRREKLKAQLDIIRR